MVPGMGHCSGGEGPDSFDMLTPLDRWVEGGVVPAQMAGFSLSAYGTVVLSI